MKEAELKILYIEDDRASRLLVKKVLQQAGFQVLEAATGLEGFRLAKKEKPDLILMDIQLPDISGTELTTKIKNTPELGNVPVVALSALQGENQRSMFLVAGCDGYIQKPIDKARFPKQIREFLRGKKEHPPQEKVEAIRQQYQRTLVDRLTDKVEQLEQSNKLLRELTQTLQDYNQKLELLHHIVLELQLCQHLEELKEKLFGNICQHFQVQRCAFLEIHPEGNSLYLKYACGLNKADLNYLQIAYRPGRFENLFKDAQVLVVEKPEQIRDEKLRAHLQKSKAFPFLFGMLGVAEYRLENFIDDATLQEMVDALEKELPGDIPLSREAVREHLREYFSPEIFLPGGFFYIDLKSVPLKARQHTIQLLEMLLRTASLIYQNLQLRIQLRNMFLRAEKEAITDPLTQLYNFRYLMLQLEREVYRSSRHNSPLAVLMIDIDHFKVLNDTLGHPAGNEVLKKLARLLQENTRGSDIVARYGGEEFVVICPELHRKGALKMAEKLRSIVSRTHFPGQESLPEKKLTISVGVAIFPEDGKTALELIRAADAAMYQAKRAGRNRVRQYQTASA